MEDKKPFEGLKVIDFTWSGAGPFIINFLAYYGATVLRIESSSRPDPVRHGFGYKIAGPGGLESGPVFAVTHPVKKLDLGLNMKQPKSIGMFKKLVAWSDVVMENFTTGAVERMGLGYEDLKKIKKNIIMFRSNGFGHSGPLAAQPGFGMTVTSIAGFHGIVGWPDRPSVPVSRFYTDHLSPLMGAVMLLTAVDYWQRTGEGQCIDLSQVEAGINYLGPVILDYTANGRKSVKLVGNHCDYAAPHGAYRCKGEDRWVAIGMRTDEEWECFCDLIGNPAWTLDPKFDTLGNRVKNADELDKFVNEWTKDFTAEQVMTMLQDNGISAGVVATAQDAENDPQLKHYNFFQEIDHPFLGPMKFYHPPGFTLSDAKAQLGRPPIIGEDNEYVCKEILGMSKTDIEQLLKEGVLEH
jgi:benzylsuccinate CoA-transferase BbsF subunit